MKRSFTLTILLMLTIEGMAQKYPFSKTVDRSDTWHNITIKDPYRWMEDLASEETKAWFKAQNDYTSEIINKLPLTDELYKGFLKLDSIQPDQTSKIRQVGNALFYFNIKLGEAKAKICRRNGETAPETVIADYTMWGANYNISNYEIDPYQQYIAVTAMEGGKEKSVVKFYSIAENKMLKDSIPGIFAGFAPGAGNIFYLQQPSWDVHVSINEKDKWFLSHKIGTDTLQDKIYLSYKTNPELYTDNSKSVWPFWPSVLNDDVKYEFVARGSVSPYYDLYYRKVNSNGEWKKIFGMEDEIVNGNNWGDKFFFISKKNAPNGKLMLMDMRNPDLAKSTLIIPEQDVPMQAGDGLTQSKNFLMVPYIKNGVQMHHKIVDMRYNKVSKLPFPETSNQAYITPFNKTNDEVHIVRTGWTTPITFSYSNLEKPYAKEKKFAFRKDPVFPYVDEVKVEEIEIPGHDGVMIPISIISKKNLPMNKQNVAYVYSYGAYGISSNAGFNPEFLQLAAKGIVIVVAHVRGGGEKGESWHFAGFKQTKANTWKDLNSTAEYLISKGYTSPEHLACEGGSAGGILIGRAITERPDLWACAVPQVGCLTMVRQEFAPNGPINTPEFGSVKNINEFFGLMQMDALLHVQPQTKYPAMLITTGWNDPRVISWQPAKFAAAVQQANTSNKPTLLQVDYNAGHGDSEDKYAGIKKEAKKWAFILSQTGYKN